jgi:hypothetical protein
MMFAYLIIRRASLHVNAQHRRALFGFIDTQRRNANNVRQLLEQILVAFDVNLVYSLVEHIKSIVWALVRTVYARNTNLLSLNRHLAHVNYATLLLPKATRPRQLYEYAKALYKRYCVYELAEDSLSWNELMCLLRELDKMFAVDCNDCSRISNGISNDSNKL